MQKSAKQHRSEILTRRDGTLQLHWVMPKADATWGLTAGDRHRRWQSAVALVRDQTEMAVCPCGKPQLKRLLVKWMHTACLSCNDAEVRKTAPLRILTRLRDGTLQLPWVMPKADATWGLTAGDRHRRWVRDQTETAVCPCGKPQLKRLLVKWMHTACLSCNDAKTAPL